MDSPMFQKEFLVFPHGCLDSFPEAHPLPTPYVA